MILLRIVIPLYLLFEHDLFRKTGTHFSGSCSSQSNVTRIRAAATIYVDDPLTPRPTRPSGLTKARRWDGEVATANGNSVPEIGTGGPHAHQFPPTSTARLAALRDATTASRWDPSLVSMTTSRCTALAGSSVRMRQCDPS